MKLRNRKPKQGGVILILTLFVILITYALVAQLTIGTSVAYQTSKNGSDRIRMRTVAMSAAEEVLTLLADDAPGTEGEAGAAGMGEAGGADSLGSGEEGAAPGAESEGEGEEPEDDGSNSDSFEDEWSRSARFPIGDMEVTAFVQDENSKFNLLSMFQSDADLQEQARDRFVRILDQLRDNFDDDLTQQDATTILEELVVWVEGDNRDLDFPAPLRHSSKFIGAEEEVSADGEGGDGGDGSTEPPEEESDAILYDQLYLPVSLEELMLLEHVDEDLFFDQQRRNDQIAPGMQTVFTVYTSLALDPPSSDELGSSSPEPDPSDSGGFVPDDPGATEGGLAGASNPEEDSPDSAVEAEGGLDDLLDAGAALGPAINLNTAPAAVLRSLQSTNDMPEFMIEAILRYRNKIDEEALSESEGAEVDYKELELQRALYREDKPTPHQYFRNLEELNEVEGWEDRLEPEQREAFLSLVGVQSDVFSIYLFCRVPAEDWQQKRHYEEPPGPILRLKAVVWRRSGENGAKFLYIEPWHEVRATRWRIPDFQDELGVYELPLW
jgi:hypothetical protein